MDDSSIIAVKLGNAVPGGDTRAPFNEFTNVVNAIKTCLGQVGRCIEKPGADFAISHLAMGSAELSIAPKADSKAYEVAAVFNDTVEALQIGRPVDPRLDFGALKCFSGLATLSRSADYRLAIGHLLLTPDFSANLNALVGEIGTSHGSVSGQLEAILIHNKNQFTIYPPIANERIECSFSPKDLPKVLEAVGRHVTVFGVLHHSKAKIFPNRVEVETFEVEPENSELPSLLNTTWPGPLPVDLPSSIDGQFCDEWF